MPKVSVIMPVFNAGKWFRPAIESVLNQTFRDFELLLLDDGATDGSAALCDEIAKADGRVRVFHQANRGICKTRNRGIELARGKYVCFCDHDDLYEPQYLELSVTAAEEHNSKLVKFDHTTERRWPNGRLKAIYGGAAHVMKTGVYLTKDLSSYKAFPIYRRINSVIWDCLFERAFLIENGLKFNESFKCGGEDGLFMLHVLAALDSLYYISKILYRHYENVGLSTSAKYHPELEDAYIFTASEEHRLIPCGFETAFCRYKRWFRGIYKYIFDIRGCTATFSHRADVIFRLYETIFNGATLDGVKLSPKDRLSFFLLGHGMKKTYLLLKESGFRLRTPLREIKRRKMEAALRRSGGQG